MGMDASEAASGYLKTQLEKDLFSENNWKIIYQFVDNSKPTGFNFLLTKRNEFALIYGRDSVNQKISKVYFNDLSSLIRDKR